MTRSTPLATPWRSAFLALLGDGNVSIPERSGASLPGYPPAGGTTLGCLPAIAEKASAEAGGSLESVIDDTVNGRLTSTGALAHRELASTRWDPDA